MGRTTLRIPDEIMQDVRWQAAARGQSVNAWVTTVVRAASDPTASGGDVQAVRERLRRAGLPEIVGRVQGSLQEEVSASGDAAGSAPDVAPGRRP